MFSHVHGSPKVFMAKGNCLKWRIKGDKKSSLHRQFMSCWLSTATMTSFTSTLPLKLIETSSSDDKVSRLICI
jgi:hypothetical protein